MKERDSGGREEEVDGGADRVQRHKGAVLDRP